MTKREKSWLIHLARNAAMEAARAEGHDPQALESLMDAATFEDGYPLGPYRLIYNGQTITLSEKLTQRYAEAREQLTTGHMVFILAEPDAAWACLRLRSTFKLEAYEEMVRAFMQDLSGAEIAAADAWFREEKARLETASEEVSESPRPQAEAGASTNSSAPAAALGGCSPSSKD